MAFSPAPPISRLAGDPKTPGLALRNLQGEVRRVRGQLGPRAGSQASVPPSVKYTGSCKQTAKGGRGLRRPRLHWVPRASESRSRSTPPGGVGGTGPHPLLRGSEVSATTS